MTYSILFWLETQMYWVRIPAGSDICHRGCAYSVYAVLQTVQRDCVYNAIYDTVPNKEPWSGSIRVWHSPEFCLPSVAVFHVYPSSLGQSHASAYRRSLAVSSTTNSYSVYVVIVRVCLRFKLHWMFQIYKYVIKGREELTSCSSLIHSHMFP